MDCECLRLARATRFALRNWTTRWKRVGGCLPVIRGGLSCAEATSKRAESQGLPVWSRHVGDPILKSNITRRVDFALFMVEALESDKRAVDYIGKSVGDSASAVTIGRDCSSVAARKRRGLQRRRALSGIG